MREQFIISYPTSLIGEIWFDLKDKSLLGIILLPLLMRFGLICRTWAFQIVHAIGSWGERIGLPSWVGARAPCVYRAFFFLGLWQVGLRAYFQTLSVPFCVFWKQCLRTMISRGFF